MLGRTRLTLPGSVTPSVTLSFCSEAGKPLKVCHKMRRLAWRCRPSLIQPDFSKPGWSTYLIVATFRLPSSSYALQHTLILQLRLRLQYQRMLEITLPTDLMKLLGVLKAYQLIGRQLIFGPWQYAWLARMKNCKLIPTPCRSLCCVWPSDLNSNPCRWRFFTALYLELSPHRVHNNAQMPSPAKTVPDNMHIFISGYTTNSESQLC